MYCILHARHEDITTLLVPHYVHTTCHNLQRHTEHMIRAYTAQWTQTAVCHIEVDSVLIVVRVLVCTARNFVPPCASDSRGWHTYLVQQYRSTRRKSKYDHGSKKCMPCGAIYTIDAYQCFVYIAYKKTVSQSVENLVCPLYRCT